MPLRPKAAASLEQPGSFLLPAPGSPPCPVPSFSGIIPSPVPAEPGREQPGLGICMVQWELSTSASGHQGMVVLSELQTVGW